MILTSGELIEQRGPQQGRSIMKETAYLIVDRNGIRGVRKTRPSLKGTEVAIRLRVEIPDEFFERVIPDATLIIPEEAVLTPPVEIGVETTWEDSREDGEGGSGHPHRTGHLP